MTLADFANAPNGRVFAKLQGAPRNVRCEFHYSMWPEQPRENSEDKTKTTCHGSSNSKAVKKTSIGPSAVAGPAESTSMSSKVPCSLAGQTQLNDACQAELWELIRNIPCDSCADGLSVASLVTLTARPGSEATSLSLNQVEWRC